MNAINTDLAQGLLAAVEELDSNDGLTAERIDRERARILLRNGP